MHYTPAQTRWFLKAVNSSELEERRAAAITARAAQASDKGFREYLSQLKPPR